MADFNSAGLNSLPGYFPHSTVTNHNGSKPQVQNLASGAQGQVANLSPLAGATIGAQGPVGRLPSLAATRIVTREQAQAEAKEQAQTEAKVSNYSHNLPLLTATRPISYQPSLLEASTPNCYHPSPLEASTPNCYYRSPLETSTPNCYHRSPLEASTPYTVINSGPKRVEDESSDLSQKIPEFLRSSGHTSLESSGSYITYTPPASSSLQSSESSVTFTSMTAPTNLPPPAPFQNASPLLQSSGPYVISIPLTKPANPINKPAEIVFLDDPLIKRLGSEAVAVLDSSNYNYPSSSLHPESQAAKMHEEFMDIYRMSQELEKNTSLVAQSMALAGEYSYLSLNRYSNILPFDDNRVPLTDRNNKDEYINASPIKVGNTKFIATQGPLPYTTESFFRMIDQHDIALIVCLTMAEEPNRSNPEILDHKCAPYWNCHSLDPCRFTWGKIVQVTSHEIILTSGETAPTSDETTPTPHEILLMKGKQGLVRRKFLIEDKNGNQDKTFEQLHYINWPDHGSPDPIVFQALLREVEKSQKKNEKPVVVHCSAGVGRTGTFMATHSLVQEALENKEHRQLVKEGRGEEVPLNVAKRMMELRCQRSYCVQSPAQYAAIRQGVLDYFQAVGPTLE